MSEQNEIVVDDPSPLTYRHFYGSWSYVRILIEVILFPPEPGTARIGDQRSSYPAATTS